MISGKLVIEWDKNTSYLNFDIDKFSEIFNNKALGMMGGFEAANKYYLRHIKNNKPPADHWDRLTKTALVCTMDEMLPRPKLNGIGFTIILKEF